jgi:hypothetical protein
MEKKLAFIHIPKNAGWTIKDAIKKNNLNIIYIHHKYSSKISNTEEIVVIRDPIQRFVSAFNYSKTSWKNPIINQFNDVNELVDALMDSNNNKHKFAQYYITNSKEAIIKREGNFRKKYLHKINNKLTKYTWTIEPQSSWLINNPIHIIRMNHLEEDFNKILSNFGYPSVKMKIKNISKKYSKITNLTDKQKEFLYNMYKKDYDFIKKHNLDL